MQKSTFLSVMIYFLRQATIDILYLIVEIV